MFCKDVQEMKQSTNSTSSYRIWCSRYASDAIVLCWTIYIMCENSRHWGSWYWSGGRISVVYIVCFVLGSNPPFSVMDGFVIMYGQPCEVFLICFQPMLGQDVVLKHQVVYFSKKKNIFYPNFGLQAKLWIKRTLLHYLYWLDCMIWT